MSDENRLFIKTELKRLIDNLSLQEALSTQRQPEIDVIIRRLERINPNPQPFTSENLPRLVGNWQVLYSTNRNYTPIGTETVSTTSETLTNIKIRQNLTLDNAGNINSRDSIFIEVAAFAEWKMEFESIWNILDDNTVLVKLKTFGFGINRPLLPFILPELKIPLFDFFNNEKLWRITYIDDDILLGRDDSGTLFVFSKII